MNPFITTELFIKETAATELANFRLQRDWQSKYRIIMQLGKQLPMLPAELKTARSAVVALKARFIRLIRQFL